MQSIQDKVGNISITLERQDHRRILDWLSPREFDFSSQQTKLLNERVEGTGRWLFESRAFKLWLDGEHESIILKGGGGMGKTMLASIAIDYLSSIRNENTKLAYIFSSWSRRDEYTAPKLLANLLKQLLLFSASPLPDKLKTLHDANTYPTDNQISQLLRMEVTKSSRTFIVVDALDELHDRTRESLMATLGALQDISAVSLMITSRFKYQIADHINSVIELEIKASDEDLILWMESRLRQKRGLAAKSPDMHEQIKRTVIKAVDGLYVPCISFLSSLNLCNKQYLYRLGSFSLNYSWKASKKLDL
jgi:hypothetical protein